MHQIIDKYGEFQKPLYVVFIDYQKALDIIRHSSLLHGLQYVEHKYTEVIKYFLQ